MARRRPFELAIPPAERRVRSVLVALTASVFLHWLFIEVRMDRTPLSRVFPDIAAATHGDEVRQVELPVYTERPRQDPTPTPLAAAPKAVARQLVPDPPREIPQEKVVEPPPPPVQPPPPVVAAAPPPARADTGSKPAQSPASIIPTFSKGKLWVKPLPLPPAELAARLRGDNNGRPHMGDDGLPTGPPLADSIVTRVVQHYLDSLATEITAEDKALKDAPQWTVIIGGKEFGLDRGNLRVGGVTVPGVVMGYIRGLTGQNISHYYESKPSDALRRDLWEAGRRADNYTQFKKSIAEIRARKQEEKDFERAQRTPPPPVPDSRATP